MRCIIARIKVRSLGPACNRFYYRTKISKPMWDISYQGTPNIYSRSRPCRPKNFLKLSQLQEGVRTWNYAPSWDFFCLSFSKLITRARRRPSVSALRLINKKRWFKGLLLLWCFLISFIHLTLRKLIWSWPVVFVFHFIVWTNRVTLGQNWPNYIQS